MENYEESAEIPKEGWSKLKSFKPMLNMLDDFGRQVEVLDGTQFVLEVPKEAGRVVDTCIFNDQYFVACEYRVYVLDGKTLVPLTFRELGGDVKCE